jgi:hypothetical protein
MEDMHTGFLNEGVLTKKTYPKRKMLLVALTLGMFVGCYALFNALYAGDSDMPDMLLSASAVDDLAEQGAKSGPLYTLANSKWPTYYVSMGYN